MIEVFADVACPFTHVGLRRFVEHRARVGREDVRLRVRAWPLELVNGEPLDPALIAEEITALRTTVAPDAFAGFDEAAFPSSSMPAFALAAAAYRHGPQVGEAVSLELRALLFEHGRDIADDDLIADVERRFGLRVEAADIASVDADHREGKARGVVGSPHFFTPAGTFFCPALDIDRTADGQLQIEIDDAGFESFLDACFT